MNTLANKPNPWLIAAWPGMGNVALIAAGYLVHKLKMREVGVLAPRDHFDIAEVAVVDGLVIPPRLPRSVFFRWDNARGGRDLVVFMSEAQPASGIYAYANELLETATSMGVERVITFASMASGLHPSESPKVTGVTTDAQTLDELRRAEVEPVAEGQIGGLNGVLLGAAAERGLAGMCLLAEVPYFAPGVPNPKAARAALSVFSVLAGIDVSLDTLNRHAMVIDRALIEAFKKFENRRANKEGNRGLEEAEPQDEFGESDDAAETDRPHPAPARVTRLGFADRSRVEALFAGALTDRAGAMALKQELDRLGVFKKYEDRFLDLFRRAA